MKRYIASENLKLRHTFINKLPIIAPIATILLAILLAANYCQVDSYNWWYITILPGMLSLICALTGEVERKNKGHAILALPLSMEKVWIAKVVVMAQRLALSCIVLFIGAEFTRFIWQDTMMQTVPVLNKLLACILMIITNIWQVPLCLWLQSKIGLFGTIILNMGLNSVLSVTVVLTKAWILVPYTYTARLMCAVLEILPNGLKAEPGAVTFKPEFLSSQGILPAIFLSLLLFSIITYFTAKDFAHREAN